VPTHEGTIAGDFWCIAFDEHRLRPRVPDQVAGMGLAGALVCELLVSGHAEVTSEGELHPLNVQPPAEAVARSVFESLWAHPDERDLAIWIKYLALTSFDDVARRLVLADVVRAGRPGGLMAGLRRAVGSGREVMYEATNGSKLAWPAVRVGNMLRGTPEAMLNLPDLLCAGLAVATGLLDHVLWDPDLHAQARRNLPSLLTQIPPASAMVLARTESAVGDAVLTNRT